LATGNKIKLLTLSEGRPDEMGTEVK